MNQLSLLSVARSILAQPTAPFHEDAVRGEILQLLAQIPHVTTRLDSFGNVIARFQRGQRRPRFALAAHMDHPAYVGSEFLGGVPESYRDTTPPTRDFGAFSMWDLPAYDIRDGRIYSRACDDLIGCAVIVAAFLELGRSGAEASVYALFTRAEEVGFVGAIHLAKSGEIPHDITVLSLECSSEKGGSCKMGEGAILRVGDRTSIFDSDVMGGLSEMAKRAEIQVQRCLMSGGTCEATAYQLYGYRCGALCVALGNYHNCGPDNRIDSEFVSIDDVVGLLGLCVVAAQCEEVAGDSNEALRSRLEKRADEYASRFGEASILG
ncbi:MAG TPA: M20/M25/M40 family metallo-hydrolase [Chthoniobacteraceae bacterium]|jgi:endoglucanase|nr:M20/M25/M40 family metallo-hydrolase [Chthoniobacteraceae bacterium]